MTDIQRGLLYIIRPCNPYHIGARMQHPANQTYTLPISPHMMKSWHLFITSSLNTQVVSLRGPLQIINTNTLESSYLKSFHTFSAL